MELGKALIDKITQSKGWTRYRIAQELGVNESFLGQVYRGKKPIPPLLAGDLANLAGDDPRAAALQAEIAQVSPEKRPHYEQLFKMAHAAGVAAIAIGMGLAALPAQRAEAHNAPQHEGTSDRLCIMSNARRRIRRGLERLFHASRIAPAYR
jgi:transcriptional regulator with XRE-family HTH domain